jgi:succinoglycan biosynthesis protein ExoM
MLISVCICTFKRPAMLLDLLDALGRQVLVEPRQSLELVVVDNDPAHSARAVLQQWRAPAGVVLRYFHVPQPNIAVARNTTIAHARGEWIAFIDDDESPAVDWLQQLLATQQRCQADVVFGPVVPRYRPDTPDWVKQGRFFERPRHASGTPIDEREARTGNVLLRASALRAMPGPFDEAFGRTGGEDSVLFRDLIAQSLTLVWCDEAPVSEEVPADRATARWLLRRSYRVGQTWIRAEVYRLTASQRRWRAASLGVRALVQLLLSVLLAAVWVLISRPKGFHWLRTACSQAGKLTGMTRFQFHEYGG